jgi:hypothetical protein
MMKNVLAVRHDGSLALSFKIASCFVQEILIRLDFDNGTFDHCGYFSALCNKGTYTCSPANFAANSTQSKTLSDLAMFQELLVSVEVVALIKGFYNCEVSVNFWMLTPALY